MKKAEIIRPIFDEYFMFIAAGSSLRSTCLRRRVGAVITIDRHPISTGYNGSPQRTKHCSEIGCLREKLGIPSGERGELCRGAHAEQNVIAFAAQYGISVKGATMYVTNTPCSHCAKSIINSGIVKVVFDGDYPDKIGRSLLREAEIKLIKYSGVAPVEYFKKYS